MSHNNARCEVCLYPWSWLSQLFWLIRQEALPYPHFPLVTFQICPLGEDIGALPREGNHAGVTSMWVAVFPARISKLNTLTFKPPPQDVNSLYFLIVKCCPSKFRHIYWSDARSQRIEVAKLDGRYRKWLISTQLDQPAAVVVNPKLG